MSSKTWMQIAIDLGIGAAIIVYFLAETNPDTFIYMREWGTRLRYKVWQLRTPVWLQEALTVRGKTS